MKKKEKLDQQISLVSMLYALKRAQGVFLREL